MKVYVVVLEMPDTSPRHLIEAVFSDWVRAESYTERNDNDYEYSIVEMEIQ